LKSFETFEGSIGNGKGRRSSATKEGKEEIGKLTSLYQGFTGQNSTDRSDRGSLYNVSYLGTLIANSN